MKRHISVGTVCWAALAVVITAQSGAQTPERRSPAGTKRKNGPPLTVIGCLQPGASTPAVATDRSGALPGSSMNAAASRAGYQLYGNVGEMNKLVNRRVEVMGTLDTQTGGDGKAAGSMSGAGTTSSPMRRLNVTSFRDTSGGATCSAGGQ